MPGWMGTLGGVSSGLARGSSEPIGATETGSQRAAASETRAANPASVSDSRTPCALASSPHHQLPNAMPANAMVWYVASIRPVTQRGEDSCTAMLKLAKPSVQTDPARTWASSVSAVQWLCPIAIIATQARADRALSWVSLVKRLRNPALASAPSIAPIPKPPSKMP